MGGRGVNACTWRGVGDTGRQTERVMVHESARFKGSGSVAVVETTEDMLSMTASKTMHWCREIIFVAALDPP